MSTPDPDLLARFGPVRDACRRIIAKDREHMAKHLAEADLMDVERDHPFWIDTIYIRSLIDSIESRLASFTYYDKAIKDGVKAADAWLLTAAANGNPRMPARQNGLLEMVRVRVSQGWVIEGEQEVMS